MKATGIVRRMDDLGRVVVPKELRRTMKISEGTPLEIFIDKDGSIIFRKYSPVGELNESAKNMAECISAASGIGTAVCDRDRIIATAGIPKKDLLDKPVSKQLDELMRRKRHSSPPARTPFWRRRAGCAPQTQRSPSPVRAICAACSCSLKTKTQSPAKRRSICGSAKLASDFLSRETVE